MSAFGVSGVSAEEAAGGGGGGVRTGGRPVFSATAVSAYDTVEREDITDVQRLQYKQFQLGKLLDAVERRDNVYKALAHETYVGGRTSIMVLGTPFPVIEPLPHGTEVLKAIRWYEYAAGVGVYFAQVKLLQSQAKFRNYKPQHLKGLAILPVVSTLGIMTLAFDLGRCRLQGLSENKYEAMKFGVFDTKENLERKAKNWAKYDQHKKDWMRRWNLSQYDERPGESGGLMSAIIFSSPSIKYNTEFNYPPRKNPFHLTTKPLRDYHSQSSVGYSMPNVKRTDLNAYVVAKPELVEKYAGPNGRLSGFARVNPAPEVTEV